MVVITMLLTKINLASWKYIHRIELQNYKTSVRQSAKGITMCLSQVHCHCCWNHLRDYNPWKWCICSTYTSWQGFCIKSTFMSLGYSQQGHHILQEGWLKALLHHSISGSIQCHGQSPVLWQIWDLSPITQSHTKRSESFEICKQSSKNLKKEHIWIFAGPHLANIHSSTLIVWSNSRYTSSGLGILRTILL